MKAYLFSGHARASKGRAPTSVSPSPEQINVFTLGGVAELLRVPKNRIKNWTIGRPFRIIPRILAAQGKGSRNLYSLEDVYVFALVNQLYRDGFTNAAIKAVLDVVFLTPKLGPVQRFTLTNQNGKWWPRFVQTSGRKWRNEIADETGVEPTVGPGVYTLNVRRLVAWVNSRVQDLKREGTKHADL